MNKEVLEIVGNGKLTGIVRKETITVSDTIQISVQNQHSRISSPRSVSRQSVKSQHDMNKRAKPTQPNPSPNFSTRQKKKMHREPEVPEERVPSGRMSRLLARITSKELAPIHSVKNGILQNACSTSRRMDAECSHAHRQAEEQPGKRSKKNGDKSAVVLWKITRQLDCVFQDMEPPKSSVLRKSPNIRKPIGCVKFTKAFVRHADIRDQNPSLGMVCPGEPHQRRPNAPKI